MSTVVCPPRPPGSGAPPPTNVAPPSPPSAPQISTVSVCTSAGTTNGKVPAVKNDSVSGAGGRPPWLTGAPARPSAAVATSAVPSTIHRAPRVRFMLISTSEVRARSPSAPYRSLLVVASQLVADDLSDTFFSEDHQQRLFGLGGVGAAQDVADLRGETA